MKNTESGPVTAPALTTWKIDPVHSGVEFAVRHMMIATVKGRFRDVDGVIAFDEEDLTSGEVEVRIAAASIDTGEEARDDHLRSGDFFDVERFPELTFESRRVERAEDGYRMTGDLTIRGRTRETVLEVEDLGGGVDPWGGRRRAFHATAKVNRKDFGLTWNQALEAGGVLVGDEVRITLDIQAVAQDAEGGQG